MVCQVINLFAFLFSYKTVKYRREQDHTVLQLSWKRRKAELSEVGPVCFVIKDHVAGRRPSPSPVTTDSTVSSCCSGQLLQNGCTISAADEKALNVRGKILFIRFKARRDSIRGPPPLFCGIYKQNMAAEMRAKNIFSWAPLWRERLRLRGCLMAFFFWLHSLRAGVVNPVYLFI